MGVRPMGRRHLRLLGPSELNRPVRLSALEQQRQTFSFGNKIKHKVTGQ